MIPKKKKRISGARLATQDRTDNTKKIRFWSFIFKIEAPFIIYIETGDRLGSS